MPKKVKAAVTPRNAGPVDMEAIPSFPLTSNQSLDYVRAVHRHVFGNDSFLVVLYGALNVGGLIGTEHNGIAVLWENRGKVVLLGHYRDRSYMQPSNSQRQEYARICVLKATQFRSFINSHPFAQCQVMVARPQPIVRPKLRFRAADFTATPFHSARSKVAFLKALIQFLCDHCDQDQFSRQLYDGLSQHLGHIAHYNRDGFYAEWFVDPAARIRFLEYHTRVQLWGDWSDVRKALQQWIEGPEGQAVSGHWRNVLAAAREQAERRELARLKAVYEPANGEAP
jgi:hypothetical protein